MNDRMNEEKEGNSDFIPESGDFYTGFRSRRQWFPRLAADPIDKSFDGIRLSCRTDSTDSQSSSAYEENIRTSVNGDHRVVQRRIAAFFCRTI